MHSVGRFRATLAAATLSVVGGLGIPAPAGADVPPPNPTTADLIPEEKAQLESPAYELAHDIAEVSAHRDKGDGTGFGGILYDVEANTVDLWWKGAVDSDVQQLIDDAGRNARVASNVRQAPRTRRATLSAASRLFGPRLKAEGITVLRTSIPQDMSGIDIKIKDLRDADEKSKDTTKQKTREVAEAETGVPVRSVTFTESRHVQGVGQATTSLYSKYCANPCRQNDQASWTGGAAIQSSGLPVRWCSTGFSVTMNGTVTDKARMLSAAHCDSNGLDPVDGFYTGQASRMAYGGSSFSNGARDSLVINPQGGVRGYIYGGSSTSDYVAPVRGPRITLVNDIVRISGANSGQHNSIKVLDINDQDETCTYAGVTINCAPQSWGTKLGVTSSNARDAANIVLAQGDSGGPIYSSVGGTDPNGVYARGIAHGSTTDYEILDCDSTPVGPTLAFPDPDITRCFTGLFWFDIYEIDAVHSNAFDLTKVPL